MPSLQLRRSLSQQHAVEGRPLIQSLRRPVFVRSATLSLQQAASRWVTRIFLAIGRTYSERASSRRINEFVSNGFQCPLGRAPPGTALLAPRRRRSRSPQAVSAHSRDDPLATEPECSSNEHDPVSLARICSSRCLLTDLTLLAGDSLDEFGDRSPRSDSRSLLVQTNIPRVMTDEDMPLAPSDPFRGLI